MTDVKLIERAIERLRFRIETAIRIAGKGENGKAFEDMELAIKALEKQIPKKPILKSGESLMHINKGEQPHEWRINKWQDWVCPICGWFVGQRYNCLRSHGEPHPHDQRKSNYCNECGQHIDWGE